MSGQSLARYLQQSAGVIGIHCADFLWLRSNCSPACGLSFQPTTLLLIPTSSTHLFRKRRYLALVGVDERSYVPPFGYGIGPEVAVCAGQLLVEAAAQATVLLPMPLLLLLLLLLLRAVLLLLLLLLRRGLMMSCMPRAHWSALERILCVGPIGAARDFTAVHVTTIIMRNLWTY